MMTSALTSTTEVHGATYRMCLCSIIRGADGRILEPLWESVVCFRRRFDLSNYCRAFHCTKKRFDSKKRHEGFRSNLCSGLKGKGKRGTA